MIDGLSRSAYRRREWFAVAFLLLAMIVGFCR